MLKYLASPVWKRRATMLQLAFQRTWRTNVSAPWKRRELEVYAIPSGLGDEVMAAGVAQAASRANPDLRLVFHSRHPELFAGMSGFSAVRRLAQGRTPKNALGLTYAPKHGAPVMVQMAQYLGLPLTDFRIELPRRPESDVPAECLLPGPLITIQTTASNWTPNKQWPESHWRALLEGLPPTCTIVELGARSIFATPPGHPGYRELLGRTSLTQYAAAIQASDVFVGPVSAGMHLAHGYGVPSSIVIGGYELPHPYPLSRQFYRAEPCAPCWLRDACPHGRKCLQEIDPREVLVTTLQLLEHPPHV